MNAVVIVAHGLNCHWLGPYGNEWVATPCLDALACEAIAFDQHFAAIPTVEGYTASLDPIDDLRSAGVRTVLVDDGISRPADDRSWDAVFKPQMAAHPTRADAFLAAIEAAMDGLRDQDRWLLWIETDRLLPPWEVDPETYYHYAGAAAKFTEDPRKEEEKEETADDDEPDEAEDDVSEVEHDQDAIEPPWNAPPLGRSEATSDLSWHRLRNTFAAAVTSFDDEIDVVVQILRERGLDESALWLVTSGFGCPLGEHGHVGPAGSALHEELVHLPLLIRLPKAECGGSRASAFTLTDDLLPTLLDTFGMPTPASATGQSLLPVIRGDGPAPRPLVQICIASGDDSERLIRTSEWAFLKKRTGDATTASLFRKPDDRWEVNDVVQHHLGVVEEFETLLASGKASQSQ